VFELHFTVLGVLHRRFCCWGWWLFRFHNYRWLF